jgi:hypothetical protein
MMLLAQAAEPIGLLTTLLEGGLPLLLLVALCIVGYLYKKEKEAKDAEVAARVKAVENHSESTSKLKTEYSKKVEELLRERLESETHGQRIIIEAKDVMQSVVMQMTTLGDFLEQASQED